MPYPAGTHCTASTEGAPVASITSRSNPKAQPQADANTKKAFFTAWANLWAKTQTTEALRAEVQGSPYAPAAFRVNGPLSQLPAFGETYGCRVGAVMRRRRGRRWQRLG